MGLHPDDPRPAWEQINEAYQGGWHPLAGFEIKVDEAAGVAWMTYPGDPQMRNIGLATFRDEVLWLFPHEWVLLKGPSGEWEAARLD